MDLIASKSIKANPGSNVTGGCEKVKGAGKKGRLIPAEEGGEDWLS